VQVEVAEEALEALELDGVLPGEEGLLSEVLHEVEEALEAHQEEEVVLGGALLEAEEVALEEVALVVEEEVVGTRLYCMLQRA